MLRSLLPLLYVECFILLAAFVHELGHWLACKLLGAKTYGFRFRLLPIPAFCIPRDFTHSPWRDASITAAGPLANLVLWLALRAAGLPIAGGFSLLMALVSMVPICQQDGARIIYFLTARQADTSSDR